MDKIVISDKVELTPKFWQTANGIEAWWYETHISSIDGHRLELAYGTSRLYQDHKQGRLPTKPLKMWYTNRTFRYW